MSLPPSLWPGRFIDQPFGMCMTPNDFIWPLYNSNRTNYYRPWNWCMQDIVKDFGSTIDNQRDVFKVTLDVQHFRPEEISVKVVNNQVLVEGRHEERIDQHGFVARHFTRRYALPENCMPEDVISNLSSDGVLSVIAKKKSECEFKKDERIVPIKLCKLLCPLNEQVNINSTKDETKEEASKVKKVDAAKKNTQLMLKEDHCCLLLKPELLRDAAADSIEIRTKTMEEYEKIKACQQAGSSEQVKNTSEMLQESLAKSSVSACKSPQSCDKTKAALSETTGILEQSFGKSTTTSSLEEIMDQVCGKSSAATSTSADTFEQMGSKASAAMSTTAEILEQTCGKSSSTSVSTEKIGQSSMTVQKEMKEQTAMSTKTSEIIESSSSYKSSMASSLKEMSEELSDFVCDIVSSEINENTGPKKL